jgi:hypothetical protein
MRVGRLVEGIGAGTWCCNSFRAGFVPALAIETAFRNGGVHELRTASEMFGKT